MTIPLEFGISEGAFLFQCYILYIYVLPFLLLQAQFNCDFFSLFFYQYEYVQEIYIFSNVGAVIAVTPQQTRLSQHFYGISFPKNKTKKKTVYLVTIATNLTPGNFVCLHVLTASFNGDTSYSNDHSLIFMTDLHFLRLYRPDKFTPLVTQGMQ